jgi:tetratricopeptide (TPR) repeat protein
VALAALAPDEAVRYYLQALQLVEQERDSDQPLMVDLLIGLGISQRQAGLADFRETLLDAAHRAQNLGATDQLIVAALANNRGMFSSLGVVDDDKVEVIEAALLAMPDTDSLERALLLATLCNELTYGKPLTERRIRADEAKAMARRLGDPATIVRVLTLVEQPLEAPSTLNERVADTIEALELAESLGDPFHLYFAAVYRRICALQSGEFDVSTGCLGTMKALSERLRQPTLAWITRFHEAAEALVYGNTEDAERLGIEALQIGTDCGQPDAFPFYGAQLIIVRNEQGRLGELVSVIAALARDNAGNPAFFGAVAAAMFHAGSESEALGLLDSAAADDFASLPEDLAWLHGVLAYAEVAIELHAQKPAAVLQKLLTPFHDQIGFNGLMPMEPVALYLGGLASVLGNYEQAEASFAQASELTTRGACTFSQTRVDLAWGRMLMARAGSGDEDRARQMLERARSVAEIHGYSSVERRAISALSDMP